MNARQAACALSGRSNATADGAQIHTPVNGLAGLERGRIT